jgi:type III restriction enzyme
MAIHLKFPQSPHEIIKPELHWFPADETLREKGYDKLLPPLVAKLRTLVEEWQNSDYEGSSATSKALLQRH